MHKAVGRGCELTAHAVGIDIARWARIQSIYINCGPNKPGLSSGGAGDGEKS